MIHSYIREMNIQLAAITLRDYMRHGSDLHFYSPLFFAQHAHSRSCLIFCTLLVCTSVRTVFSPRAPFRKEHDALQVITSCLNLLRRKLASRGLLLNERCTLRKLSYETLLWGKVLSDRRLQG